MCRFMKITLLAGICLISCSRHILREAYPLLNDGKYDSEFPYRNCSRELQAISESIIKIYTTDYYTIYYFDKEARVAMQPVTAELLKKARSLATFEKTSSGSALVLLAEPTRVALLTCAHIVSHLDTLKSFYAPDENGQGGYLQNLVIKNRRVLQVTGFPQGGAMEVLASDLETDIAIIGKSYSRAIPQPITKFAYPLGNARELEWGSFVYMIGYPMGFRMVTKGIVSQPNRNGRGSFITDATFNTGFSGGAVLAIRDGVPHFELVGIATSSSAKSEMVLTPNRTDAYDFYTPYEGPVYVAQQDKINYGITLNISVEMIRDFIAAHQEELAAAGYDLSGL